ncbi:MAG TPA: hypothetical protein VN861_03155 [Candidatus Acidoferrales bacterium]|nr:hypothetical protein [Candidatus Acidoferrales bacterium]
MTITIADLQSDAYAHKRVPDSDSDDEFNPWFSKTADGQVLLTTKLGCRVYPESVLSNLRAKGITFLWDWIEGEL